MPKSVTFTPAREHLAQIWNELEDSREEAIIQRRGHEDMALIPAAELSGLRETAYLLRSPANAARLLAALERARKGESPRVDLAAPLSDPYEGIGKPEHLKHIGGNLWSRRITDADRLVYEVFDDRIEFLQARYHY